MVTIQMVDGNLVTKMDGLLVDDCGCLLKELTSWLGDGYKLSKINDGSYEVEIDENQLCRVEFEDKDNGIYFNKVMTIANAAKFKMYYGASIYLNKLGESKEIEVDLKSEHFRIIDLRGQSMEYIDMLRADDSKNIDLEESINEDMQCM